MPTTPLQVQAAQTAQHSAAHDIAPQVRLLAGPGTGKSSSIEERVHWLLSNGTPPSQIVAVSFTRAAARDLERRIRAYGQQHGHSEVKQVRVSTLHSVALRILRLAGLLAAFPVDPRVLDDWELEEIFDPEFGNKASIPQKTRREAIRRAHEAFWSTGIWNPTNYIPPNPPISTNETNAFRAFLISRGQLYACVLPGELVRKCVDAATTGTLSLPQLLGALHLIVDEYQDLNPCDLQFVHLLATAGITFFAAGDDDQSIYSFRFASPTGIQRFHENYPSASLRSLDSCFRCTPGVLNTAYTLVEAYADPTRLPKNVSSLYLNAATPVSGLVHRWRFASSRTEAVAIAQSCRDLIVAGVSPDNIMILLSSVPTLGKSLSDALTEAGLVFRPPQPKPLSDTMHGRLGLALLRIVSDSDDYVALRTGVGIKTCNAIADTVHSNNVNYREAFFSPLPNGIFEGRSLNALQAARGAIGQIQGWTRDDLFGANRAAMKSLMHEVLGPDGLTPWAEATDPLPDEMTLAELQLWLAGRTEIDRKHVLLDVTARLGESDSQPETAPAAVQLMTMHSAKGLSAQIVFIPGLEESLLPGPKRSPYPGLVSEAARLLFVSITRARAVCVLSFCTNRLTQDSFSHQTPSRFCQHLGGAFAYRTSGLNTQEIEAAVSCIANL
jgi:DNA helicase-2/ATP-dependent DNA helicase PcrA